MKIKVYRCCIGFLSHGIVVLLILAGLTLPASAGDSKGPALLCASKAIPKGPSHGLEVYYPDQENPEWYYWAGSIDATIDEVGQYEMYCVDIQHTLCKDVEHEQNEDIDSLEVIWILNNYYPNTDEPSGLSSLNEKAAAVQLAIWHICDGLDFPSPGGVPANVFHAAREIVTAAGTAVVPKTPTKLALNPTTAVNPVGTQHALTATLLDQNGNPIAGEKIKFFIQGANSTSGHDITDSNGQAVFSYLGNSVGDDTIKAKVYYTIPVGLRWTRPECQKLILGQEAPGVLEETATKEWVNCCTATAPDYGGVAL
jgi:TQXA domain-containing protein